MLYYLIFCISLLSGCGASKAASKDTSGAEKARYHKISAQEAFTMMSGLNEYILLDVRTLEEYQEQRIEGAVLIPDNEIQKRAEKELPDRSSAIFVYCRSGRRSANAARQLVSLGYTKVYDFGGIGGWTYGTVGQ